MTSTKQNNVTDVLVIGSGMGGAAMSKRLSDAGIKVMCLEQGDWVHPTQFPHFHDEWEFEKYRSWDFNTNLRKGPEDYPVTGIALPRMVNAVGGSTIHFAGHWFRYRPADFRKGTEHGSRALSTGHSPTSISRRSTTSTTRRSGLRDCAATQATRRDRNVTARRSSRARAGGGWRRPGIGWAGNGGRPTMPS